MSQGQRCWVVAVLLRVAGARQHTLTVNLPDDRLPEVMELAPPGVVTRGTNSRLATWPVKPSCGNKMRLWLGPAVKKRTKEDNNCEPSRPHQHHKPSLIIHWKSAAGTTPGGGAPTYRGSSLPVYRVGSAEAVPPHIVSLADQSREHYRTPQQQHYVQWRKLRLGPATPLMYNTARCPS